MQSRINLAAILALAALASGASALAQTGEFANQPPGSVVHQGYALQDQWQARKRASTGSSFEPVQGPKPRQIDSYETTKRHDK
jgi:hypothetical protein